jgi:nitrate/nitrite transporter NarK
VFPTVLAGEGWSLRAAGLVLSVALGVGVVCRIGWGGIADRRGSRPILAIMGIIMSLAAFAAAFLTPTWPVAAVIALASLFGISAYCWAGIGIAETVRLAPSRLISEASAGIIALTFLGALAGPALFSTSTALTGSFRPAFLILGALSFLPSLSLLRRQPAAATPS